MSKSPVTVTSEIVSSGSINLPGRAKHAAVLDLTSGITGQHGDLPGWAKDQQAFRINPALISIEPGWNPREQSSMALDELIPLIRMNGVTEPVHVVFDKDGKLTVIAGERRVRACRALLLENPSQFPNGIPCILETEKDRARLLVKDMLSNESRAYLPLEKCAAFKRLVLAGWSQASIAERTGYTEARISSLLVLTEAAPDTCEAIRSGEITAASAITLVRAAKGDAAKQGKAVTLAATEKASAKLARAAKQAERKAAKQASKAKTTTSQVTSSKESTSETNKLASESVQSASPSDKEPSLVLRHLLVDLGVKWVLNQVKSYCARGHSSGHPDNQRAHLMFQVATWLDEENLSLTS